MIHIKRSDQVPASLTSVAVVNAQNDIARIAVTGKPMSKQFRSLWGAKDVRDALWTMQNKKCGYCERRREVNRESDIDHFRPKAEVTFAPGHKGYWWLAYKWTNLLFSCRHCNQSYKLNHFPVPDETKRVRSEAEDVRSERAYLIDPCGDMDDPESCFTYYVKELKLGSGRRQFLAYIQARPDEAWNQQRAEKTIDVLQLNRKELREERGDCVDKLNMLRGKMHYIKFLVDAAMADRAKIDEVAQEIKEATRASLPFAGFCREYFRINGFGKFVSTD
jgi:uncharacterized protein (TIGR02646 family)